MSWSYKGVELTDDAIPDKSVGFLYLITNKNNGKRYLGKKLLSKPKYRMINKKKKKFYVDSDWREYWSSSPWLLEIIEAEGKDSFTREILLFTFSKGENNFAEECLQYRLGVLESEDWYNSNIRAKVFKKNVMKYNCLTELREIESKLK